MANNKIKQIGHGQKTIRHRVKLGVIGIGVLLFVDDHLWEGPPSLPSNRSVVELVFEMDCRNLGESRIERTVSRNTDRGVRVIMIVRRKDRARGTAHGSGRPARDVASKRPLSGQH
jgi:hypothetical protein